LYRLCDNAGAPKYLCDEFLAMLKEQMLQNSFDPLSPTITKRRTFFPRVQQQLGIPSPEAIPVKLESSGEIVVVYRFHFLERLQRHLLSEVYSDTANLSLPNPHNVWSSLLVDPVDYSSTTKSTWYRDTCQIHHQKLSTGKYMLHPLTLYIDKTGADGVMRNTLEPLVCTSNMLTYKARNDSSNWFVLGYIPHFDDSSNTAAGKGGKKGKSVSVRDYHRCLSVLLEPIKMLQKEASELLFRRGAETAPFRIICPIATVLGDNLSNNKLCGKSSNSSPSAVRMSRCCLTAFDDADQVPHVCTPVDGSMIHTLCMDAMGCCHGYDPINGAPGLQDTGDPLSPNLPEWEKHLATLLPPDKNLSIALRKVRENVALTLLHDVYGSHCFDNAFDGMDFGADSDIHQCTMADLMHSVDEGIFKYVIDCILGSFGQKLCKELNNLVEKMFAEKGCNRSGERPNYPWVSFKGGWTKTTQITADERVGQLFIIAILLHAKQGRELLQPRFELTDSTTTGGGTIRENTTTATTGKRRRPSSEPVGPEQPPNPPAQGVLSRPQQEDVLAALGLGYVTSHCLPGLPSKHQQILRARLDSLLTPNLHVKLQKAKELKLPEEMMPFRPTHITGFRRRASVLSSLPPVACPMRRLPRPRGENLTLRFTLEQTGMLVQQLLAFHAFAKYGGSLLSSNEAVDQYRESFNTMMAALKLGIQREADSNGFKLQKFLECSHFLPDHLRHGPTVEHNSDTGERGLKQWGKKVAATAQKRSDTIFKAQVMRNVQETEILDILQLSCQMRGMRLSGSGGNDTITAHDAAEAEKEARDEAQELGFTGRNFVFEITPISSGIYRAVDMGRATAKRAPVKVFPKQVLRWLEGSFRQVLRTSHGGGPTTLLVQLVTEIRLVNPESNQTDIVRAHPDYRGEGCWYDFVEVDYGALGKYPARCVLFFLLPSLLVGRRPLLGGGPFEGLEELSEGELVALVQPVKYQSRAQKMRNSLLFSDWTLEYTTNRSGQHGPVTAKFALIAAASINKRIFAIDLHPGDGGPFYRNTTTFEVVQVEDRQQEWPARFLTSHQGWV
jgi:hypothetical protein